MVDSPMRFIQYSEEYPCQAQVICGSYGNQRIRYHRSTFASRIVGYRPERLIENWSRLWPAIESAVRQNMVAYDQEDLFGSQRFDVMVNRSGGWISDELMLELAFLNPADPDLNYHVPTYIIAVRRGRIVHSQATF